MIAFALFTVTPTSWLLHIKWKDYDLYWFYDYDYKK